MAQCGVYTITHTGNGKMYVGSSGDIRLRLKKHRCDLSVGKHTNKKLQFAWNKYGADAFAFRVVLICGHAIRLFYEQRFIDAHNCVANGYNIRAIAGSGLGLKHTPEAIEKIRAAGRGRIFTAERRENIAAALRGRSVPEEQRAKIRAKRALQVLSADTIARRAKAQTGLKRSEATRAKMRVANKGVGLGRTLSPEHVAAIQAGRAGYKHSPDTRAKIGAANAVAYARKAAQGYKFPLATPETKAKMSAARKAYFARKRAMAESQLPHASEDPKLGVGSWSSSRSRRIRECSSRAEAHTSGAPE